MVVQSHGVVIMKSPIVSKLNPSTVLFQHKALHLRRKLGSVRPYYAIGVDFNAPVDTDKNGGTLLHIAAATNDNILARFLVSMGADVSIEDKQGQTAFDIAKKLGNQAVLDELSLPPDKILALKAQALFLMLKHQDKKRFIELITQSPELASSTEFPHWTLVHEAANSHGAWALEFLKKYLDTYDFQDTSGSTPLHYACAQGDLNCVDILLEEPSTNINHQNRVGLTPLHQATIKGHTHVVKRLLAEANISSHLPDGIYGGTALHFAAHHGFSDIVELLVKQNPGVQIVKDKDHKTPYDYACSEKHSKCITLLQPSLLMAALKEGVETNNLDKLISLIEERDVVSENDFLGTSPISIAIELDSLELAQALIRKGVNLNTVDENGDPPLLNCLYFAGHPQIAKALLESQRVDIEQIGREKNTPLIVAIFFGHYDIAKQLIKMGANVNQHGLTPGFHHTPLTLAGSKGNLELVRLLLKHKANPMKKGVNGITPLEAAVQSGNASLISLIQTAILLAENKRNSLQQTRELVWHYPPFKPTLSTIIEVETETDSLDNSARLIKEGLPQRLIIINL